MIENKPAGFWIRFLAFIIDGLFVSLLTWLVAALITGEVEQLQQSQPQTETNAEHFSSSFYSIIFIILFTASRYKGSPGKMLCRIQVTNEDGSKISILKSLGRYFAYILSAIILMIGFMMAGWTERKKALHDYICQTVVTYRD
uniref:RDD family protein n=1 Tax=uncultured Allobacillus sp. TaxID=1638025 RepID=UPI0025921CFC|nr:RDD family protein [uncultured Allobacillus sp.]